MNAHVHAATAALARLLRLFVRLGPKGKAASAPPAPPSAPAPIQPPPPVPNGAFWQQAFAIARSAGRLEDFQAVHFLMGFEPHFPIDIFDWDRFGSRAARWGAARWGAALSPERAYAGIQAKAPKAPPHPRADGGSSARRGGGGAAGLAYPARASQAIAADGSAELQGSARPANIVDQIGRVHPWTIGADEELGPTHPMLAMAFFGGLARRGSLPQDDPTERARCAALFARALSGDVEALDGLDPLWLEGVEESRWARSMAADLMEAALPLAASLRERQAIAEESAEPSPMAIPRPSQRL